MPGGGRGMATGPIETHLHHSFNWENGAPGAREGPRGRSVNCGSEPSAQCVRLRSEINLCVERLGIEPVEAIYIGDARSDYEAARNAGMAFGYATWGSVSAEGIDGPDYVFDAPGDILAAV